MSGSIRIIGGRWRGSRIAVTDRDALRPTPDRVRETLFNWLAPMLPGARCLDLFAGTGVLALEALSRGAAAATAVESDALLARAIAGVGTRLHADDLSVHHERAESFLGRTPQPCDVVFVDPPFRQGLVAPVLQRLAAGWLSPDALVYVESEPELVFEVVGFSEHRAGRTRQTGYRLLRFTA